MGTGMFDSNEFTFDAALAEAGTYHHACHAFQCFCYIVLCQRFTVYKIHLNFTVVVSSCL